MQETTQARDQDAANRYRTLERRLDDLNARKDRLVEAFVYDRAIDQEICVRQLDKLNKEIALVEAEMLDRFCSPKDWGSLVVVLEPLKPVWSSTT